MRRAIRVIGVIVAMAALAATGQPRLEASTRHGNGGSAVLGATYDAWRHAMGSPMKNSTHRLVYWAPCADGTTPHLSVRFSGGRAASITGQDCPKEPMDTPTRRADAVIYMSQDAVITPTLSFSSWYGPGQSTTVAVYRSVKLGRLLPALDFQDCNGNPVPPGTLFLNLHTPGDQGWRMGIGTCM